MMKECDARTNESYEKKFGFLQIIGLKWHVSMSCYEFKRDELKIQSKKSTKGNSMIISFGVYEITTLI